MRMKFFYQFIILASILFFVSCLSRRTNLSTYPNANPNPTTNTTLDTENISSENQEEITDSVIEYVKSFKIILWTKLSSFCTTLLLRIKISIARNSGKI